MRFTPDEAFLVMEALRSPGGKLIMREMLAEALINLGSGEAGAVNYVNGRRSLALEFIDRMAEQHDGTDAQRTQPDADAAVAVRGAVRARLRAAASARRAARTRGNGGGA